MLRRPPRPTRTDTLFTFTTRFRSCRTQDYAACLCRTADFCGSAMPKFGIVRAFATVAVVSDFVGCSTGAYPVDVTANRLFPRGEALTLAGRSEEHTSELQSLMRISYAVFCLNKKTKDNITCYWYASRHCPNIN